MIYKSSEGDLDLSKITRLYPAVVVDMQGEVAEMSLEWEELYGDKVKIVHWVLVFDFTPLNEDVKERTTLVFETKEELIEEIQKVAPLLA
jgi:predicted nucleotidyltransferase